MQRLAPSGPVAARAPAGAAVTAPSVLSVDGRDVRLTSLERVVFPHDALTKGDVVNYHLQVAGAILPHLRRRPLTLVRYREGIAGESFFQKEAPRGTPAWVRRAKVPKRGGVVEHVTCDDRATLVWVANQNGLVLHVMPVRAPRLARPDLVIFDLDPPPGSGGATVVEGAQLLRGILERAGLVPFVKTSGSKGLHIVAPLDGSADRTRVAQFARAVADLLVWTAPDRFTTEFSKEQRDGRVFVDVLRNNPSQTVVAPYSLRALPGAPVSAPLAWDELDANTFDARAHTLSSVPGRLAERGDPWSGIGAHARPLPQLPG